MFYVQIALETLPDNPESTHLREVITPVVYFLVLTSIIVHGVTIPIGKAGSRARTLTFSRSNTNNNNDGTEGSGASESGGGRRGNLHDVSRLPPPISAGMGQLPIRETDSASSVTQSPAQMEMPDSADRMKGGRDVRFHDES